MARPYRPKRWRPVPPEPTAALRLTQALGVSPVIAQVLYNRGLTDPAAAKAFLTAGREQILDPFLLKDMDNAVALIQAQLKSGEPIMVYGDYDVDGVTGTTILVLALRALGATVDYYIPDRFTEGYGLNGNALREIFARGFRFVLSVDTGTTAVPEAELAQELGITLVISDHHEPGPVLPIVPALINPKRPDCTYPFKGLSGVGVAFKLALALGTPNAWDLLDVVTLGTIADMVPLVDENRAIVREGLQKLGATRRPGLRALMQVAGVKEPVTATHIGFALGPRINALGRMGSAMRGVDLLLTEDPTEADRLAKVLDDQNRERQEVEAAILTEALQQAEAQTLAERERVVVLAGEGWHHGVVGICASRVLEAYGRPVILLSVEGDEARGSARSIPAFHMHAALSQVADLFAKWGGHAAAAGMTLRHKDLVPDLRTRLNEIGRTWLTEEDLVSELPIDAWLRFADVTPDLIAELLQLEPHGIGNPAPVFGLEGLVVADQRFMGNEQQHLKLFLQEPGRNPRGDRHVGPAGGSPPAGGGRWAPQLEAVGWSMTPAAPGQGALVQVAFQPELNRWQGREKLQLLLKDVQVIDSPTDEGSPVNLLPTPGVTRPECLAWDPTADLQAGRRTADLLGATSAVQDARGERLGKLLAEMAPVEEEHDPPAPTRLRYIEALWAQETGPLLVRVASPWAAARLEAELLVALRPRAGEIARWRPDGPEPTGARLVIAPWGLTPRGSYQHTVLYHPPYHGSLALTGTVHLLWTDTDWNLAETILDWVLPERDELLKLWPLVKAGKLNPEALAAQIGALPGPWVELLLARSLQIFQEAGLLDASGGILPQRGKADLTVSPCYQRGQGARQALAEIRAGDWTSRHTRL
ncbi:MAG TPA: single-stranded-DNA-specific exonuclease RecJ [Symbiobacteriaceae bacterium]|nr:single-stranded-DNA-specific exonuclease RecJ [Symbiobacteriaceae bacterium]